ncbi:D-alanyl-D-alanine carboxypeptidase family protein [Arthrobacter sp. R-11]|uniref:D-alanyl-D-alanine carboxypeptidase family protein n=1 Tax=Arthrobacter sp. R-11 TaxID=3404053 RepID=UPI003CF7615E
MPASHHTSQVRVRRRRARVRLPLAVSLCAALLLGTPATAPAAPARTAVVPAARAAGAAPATVNPLPSLAPVFTAGSTAVLVNKSHPLNPLRYAPGDLVSVRGSGYYLRAQAASALDSLFTGASNAGHGLAVVSAYRSYDTQASLYDYYVRTYGQAYADTISAKPGYSEHQTGLAVDVGNAGGSCGLSTCFGETPAGRWVAANAYRYGFIVRYPNGYSGTTGYSYEPWHLRYVGPTIAADMRARSFPTLEHYFAGNPAAGATIKSGSELLAADSAGHLLLYSAPQGGSYRYRSTIGGGWSNLKQGFVVDWNADGVYDILAQWKNGVLGLYRGRPGGGFDGLRSVGWGWADMTITVGKLSRSQKYPGVLGYRPDGGLRYYANSSGGALGGFASMGPGWAGRGITLADWNNDGNNDVLAQLPGGALLYYKGNGAGGIAYPSTIGGGWQVMTSVAPAFGYAGLGTRGLLARRTDGTLSHYGFRSGSWAAPQPAGSGWAPMKLFK